jgi:hypothetical protein
MKQTITLRKPQRSSRRPIKHRHRPTQQRSQRNSYLHPRVRRDIRQKLPNTNLSSPSIPKRPHTKARLTRRTTIHPKPQRTVPRKTQPIRNINNNSIPTLRLRCNRIHTQLYRRRIQYIIRTIIRIIRKTRRKRIIKNHQTHRSRRRGRHHRSKRRRCRSRNRGCCCGHRHNYS